VLESNCQICNARPASSHLLEVAEDGGCLELHICVHCIAQLGLDLHRAPPSVAAVLAGEHEAEAGEDGDHDETLAAGLTGPGPSCPACGLDWHGFRAQNRFGCQADYDAFGERLAKLLKEIHGSDRHVGRLPGEDPGTREIAAERRLLERRLNEAIAREDFESAAELRDRLGELAERA